jgi:hypothetical protein
MLTLPIMFTRTATAIIEAQRHVGLIYGKAWLSKAEPCMPAGLVMLHDATDFI